MRPRIRQLLHTVLTGWSCCSPYSRMNKEALPRFSVKNSSDLRRHKQAKEEMTPKEKDNRQQDITAVLHRS
jgi:hypothetical protein